MTCRRVIGWTLAVLGGLVLVLLAPSTAAACGISYEDGGGLPAGDCPDAPPLVAAAVVGSLAAAVALTVGLVNYLRGALSDADLAALVATELPPDVMRAAPDLDLIRDADPTVRPGETPQQAADRAKAASQLLAYQALGDEPPVLNIATNEAAHPAAHTLERHSPDLPLRRAPTTRTIEGRIYGDHPWSKAMNHSYRWSDHTTMNRVINEAIRAHWPQIRKELANTGRFHGTFSNATGAVGDGFFNTGMYGTGPVSATYHRTSLFTIRIELVPGSNPPVLVLVSGFPAGRN